MFACPHCTQDLLSQRGPMGVVYVYDPASKSWTKKSPMPEPHVHHGMTVALNDKIYVFGGFMRPGKENKAYNSEEAKAAWAAIDKFFAETLKGKGE